MSSVAYYPALSQGLDPNGRDFIALADRTVNIPVNNQLGLLYHYSLQKWECPCESKPLADLELNEEYNQSVVAEKCSKSNATELLALGGWKADFSFRFYYNYWPISAVRDEIISKSVLISEIQYSDEDHGIVKPIFTDDSSSVDDKWKKVVENAKAYKFAEQEGDVARGVFNNWPRSLYPETPWNAFGAGSNSNTYIREMIRLAGLPASEMSGSHPGTVSSTQNYPHIYFTWTATQYRFLGFSGQPYR